MKKCHLIASACMFALSIALAVNPLVAIAGGHNTAASNQLHIETITPDSPYALPKINTISPSNAAMRSARSSLPAQFDLREQGLVTAVKDQNIFGSCWAFSSVASFETGLIKQKRAQASNLDLSEMQLAYFYDWNASAEDAHALGASSQTGEGITLRNDPLDTGGNAMTAMSVIARGTGVTTETRAPYANKQKAIVSQEVQDWYGQTQMSHEWNPDASWTLDASLATVSDYQLHEMGFRNIDTQSMPDGSTQASSTYIDIMKQDLMSNGALAISFCSSLGKRSGAVDAYTNVETGGRFVNVRSRANHMATVVGWDDTFSASNFNDTPQGDGAWIIKNSYGSLNSPEGNIYPWGVDNSGYFYLSYYDASIEDYSWFVPSTSDQEASITLQYDLLGCGDGSVTKMQYSDTAMQANIFTAPKDMELKAVSAIAPSTNATVHAAIYLLGDDACDPTDGDLASSQTTYLDGEFYTQIDLDTPVALKAGQRFSIVEEVSANTRSGTAWFTSVEFGRADNSFNSNGINATALSNPGESYLYTNGQWSDAQTLNATSSISHLGLQAGNVMIKAFADPKPYPTHTNPDPIITDDEATLSDNGDNDTSTTPDEGTGSTKIDDAKDDPTNHPTNNPTNHPMSDENLSQADLTDPPISTKDTTAPSAQPVSNIVRTSSSTGVSSVPTLAKTGDDIQIGFLVFSSLCALASMIFLGIGIRRSDF